MFEDLITYYVEKPLYPLFTECFNEIKTHTKFDCATRMNRATIIDMVHPQDINDKNPYIIITPKNISSIITEIFEWAGLKQRELFIKKNVDQFTSDMYAIKQRLYKLQKSTIIDDISEPITFYIHFTKNSSLSKVFKVLNSVIEIKENEMIFNTNLEMVERIIESIIEDHCQIDIDCKCRCKYKFERWVRKIDIMETYEFTYQLIMNTPNPFYDITRKGIVYKEDLDMDLNITQLYAKFNVIRNGDSFIRIDRISNQYPRYIVITKDKSDPIQLTFIIIADDNGKILTFI